MEKINLRIPIIYINERPVKQQDGESMKLGEILSQLIANAPNLPENKHGWQFRFSRELASCEGVDGTGIIELDPDEVAEILKVIPTGMPGMPWFRGPLKWLLGKKEEDEKSLASYIEFYGETPHEKVGGLAAEFYSSSNTSKSPANGTGEKPEVEAGTGESREEASSPVSKEALSTKDELEN